MSVDPPERPGLREETLDPEDWEELRRAGHRMVDDLIRLHRGVRERPAWQPLDPAAAERLRAPLPRQGAGLEATYEDFLRDVEPSTLGNRHPRGWGWVNGTGTTVGALAELLAAGMNTNAWGADQASSVIEDRVIGWARQVVGLPAEASGLLVSGGSMANLVALAAARDRLEGGAASRLGVRALAAQPVVYASEQVHNSVDKAVGLLGIGWKALRKVPVDAAYAMDVAALREAVRRDRAAGLSPACVVATAGTVNTGAIDPLEAIADLCRDEGLWLHVDGAFGAAAALSPALRGLLSGIERADSVAVDFHKWLHAAYGVGCVLVRDPADHRRPFTTPAAYLGALDRGIASAPVNYSHLGPELSRRFRALNVWFALRVHGTEVYGRLVEQNLRQAAELARLVEESADLELAAPVPLNVVCFRCRPPGVAEDDLDPLNREVLMRLQESGIATPSSTLLGGRFVLRAAITNHRTRSEDLLILVDAVRRLGAGVAAGG
jgi:glutamate/tyrosine decarboxylase-like PLP-dependent enzyme